jgi:RNA ligase
LSIDPSLEEILNAVRIWGPNVHEYRKLGNIRAHLHPAGQLIIFNYTQHAVFNRTWTPIERICRGLIVHWPTATVAALPFPKFFNLNESPEVTAENLPQGPCEVTIKLDGSLGILYRHEGHFGIATRGNFENKQSIWASHFLETHHNLSGFPEDITLLFEIIYPDNRVIINYKGTSGIFLIGARRLDGYDFSYSKLLQLGEQWHLPVVQSIKITNLEELIPLAFSSTGIEGWVVRYPTGLRVKIKTSEYLELHRFRFNLTPERIRELLIAGEEELERYLLSLPDEFQTEAKSIASNIRAWRTQEVARIQECFATIAPLAQESRRAFAVAARTQYLDISSHLFHLLDNQDITISVLKNADLSKLNLTYREIIADE